LAGFYVGLPDLTQPSSFTGLGTSYVETTQGSLPINIGGVHWYVQMKKNDSRSKTTLYFSMHVCNLYYRLGSLI
jgi:hypothetical protein